MSGNADILVTLSTFGEYSSEPIQILKQSGFSFELNKSSRRMLPKEVIEVGHDCIGLIAGVEKYSAETLLQMSSLRCISRCGAGIDNVDLEVAKRLGISILNTPDEPTTAVAELTLTMILSLLRRMPEVNALMHSGKWQRVTGNLLSGKVVGIIGLGRIGKRVAELVLTFGSKVIGSDLYPDMAWTQAQAVEIVERPELFKRADIVTNHASSVSGHQFILGEEVFSMMKPGSWFINMARGDMIDDNALSNAIKSGHISGAGLDVYPDEPYTGVLCDNDRVMLSPHQATLTIETRNAMETRAVENLVNHLEGLN